MAADMVFENTIRVGDLITLGSFLLGGTIFMVGIRHDVQSLRIADTELREDMKELSRDMMKLSEATVTLARQDERIKSIERQMNLAPKAE